MGFPISRRDLMKFAGGAAVGTLLTPLPWKLIDDMAIWTQTWSRIPKLPHGEVTTRRAACTLCPAGCALRLGCVGGVPFSVAAATPAGVRAGALCPIGLAAHHVVWHPRRLKEPVTKAGGRGRSGASADPVPLGTVTAALASALAAHRSASKGRVVILDGRPGRSLSALYRCLAARLPGGSYVPSIAPEERALDRLRGLLGNPPEEIGLDPESCAGVLAFGAPPFGGWAGSGTGRLSAARASGESGSIEMLLAGPRRPGGGGGWIPLRPGAEAALALGIAHHLVEEGSLPAARALRGEAGVRDLIVAFPPSRAAGLAGVGEQRIAEAAEFLARTRAWAFAGGDAGGGPLDPAAEWAVARLNLISGAAGSGGCLRPRRALPPPAFLEAEALAPPSRLEDIPDGSVEILLIDAAPWGSALTWDMVERKLAPGRSLVVSLSPYLIGHAAKADFVVPAPAWLEAMEEIPTPPACARASLAVTPAILPPPAGAVDPAIFIREAASQAGIDLPGDGDGAALIAGRCEAILDSGRGEVGAADGTTSAPVSSFGSAASLMKALEGGGVWMDDAIEWPAPPRACAPEDPRRIARVRTGAEAPAITEDYPLVLAAFGAAGLSGEGPVPPVLSKLYRESGLRAAGGTILVNPATAADEDLRGGASVVVETPRGRAEATVRIDAAVMPGVLLAAAGPDPAQLGEPGAGAGDLLALLGGGAWGTRSRAIARIREA